MSAYAQLGRALAEDAPPLTTDQVTAAARIYASELAATNDTAA